jgi:hypothetical protein
LLNITIFFSSTHNTLSFYRDILFGHNDGDLSGAIDLATLWQSRKLNGDDDDLFGDDELDEDEDVSGHGYGSDVVDASSGAADAMYADGATRDFLLPDGGVLDLSLGEYRN